MLRSEPERIDVDSLRGALQGVVLMPGDPAYDDARRVWNGIVDNRPSVIARCSTTTDVAAAIGFGRRSGLEIGVLCGGHSVLGKAIPAGGLMIDLRPMGGVRVDPAQRRAWVQGGALLGALDRSTQVYGLATTAGNVSHTGVGGLTLGGGMGWLARQHGLTCDNVVSFELVTADGRTLRVDRDENADLFWGLRGGGGNFGVVTEFEFRLHDIGTSALIVELYHPVEKAAAVLRGWRELLATAPRRATYTAWVGNGFDAPFMPPGQAGRALASVGLVWVGDPAEGRLLVDALRDLAPPVAERIDETSYLELQTMDDTRESHAIRRYWKGHYLRELTDGSIDAFLGRAAGPGDDLGLLPSASFQAYGGAIADVDAEATAFSQRDAHVEFVAAAAWTDPGEDDARITSARRYGAAMEPFATGAYVNALSDEGAAGVQRAYRPAQLARLTALKDAHDPDNVFHLNHNIPPTQR